MALLKSNCEYNIFWRLLLISYYQDKRINDVYTLHNETA